MAFQPLSLTDPGVSRPALNERVAGGGRRVGAGEQAARMQKSATRIRFIALLRAASNGVRPLLPLNPDPLLSKAVERPRPSCHN